MKPSQLAALVGTVLGTAPAVAQEYTRFEPIWVEPAVRAGEAPGCGGMALLNLPPVWTPGDAAAVVLTTGPIANATRDPLVAMLLQDHAAVLELAVGDATPCAADNTATPRPQANAVASLLGALAALRTQAGAGMVVAIGYGPRAVAALEAVNESLAAEHLGAGGPRFAAAVAVGDGPPRFDAGPPPPVREQSSIRLAAFCALFVTNETERSPEASAGAAATARACHAALTPQSDGVVRRVYGTVSR